VAFRDAGHPDCQPARVRLSPGRVPCGVRRTHAAPLAMAALVHSNGHVARAQVRDGPRQRVGQAGSGVTRVGSGLHAGQPSRPCGMVAPAPSRRFGNGPLAGRGAAVRACRAPAVARGGLRTREQATRGDTRLHPWDARTVVDGVAPPAARGSCRYPAQGAPHTGG
jgi:hypothetical protein